MGSTSNGWVTSAFGSDKDERKNATSICAFCRRWTASVRRHSSSVSDTSGKAVRKAADGKWYKRMERSRRHNADTELALFASRRAARRFKCPIVLRQQGARVVEEDAARFGQFNAARQAPKQLNVKLAFDRLDPLAERRLLHAQPLGSASDMPFLCDGNKLLKMSKLHAISNSI